MNFAFRKWKLGLVMALILSLLVAGSGLTAGMKWQAFVAVFCTAMLTHLVAFLKDHPVDSISFDEDAKPKSDPMNKILPILIIAAAVMSLCLGQGCMTKRVTSIDPSTGATNTLRVVDTNNLAMDAGVLKRLTAAAVTGALKIPSVQKDPGVLAALKSSEEALDGILDGSNPQNTKDVLALLGSSGNDDLATQVTPLIELASSLEQTLLDRYGSKVSMQIGQALARAVRDGLSTALAGK